MIDDEIQDIRVWQLGRRSRILFPYPVRLENWTNWTNWKILC